MNLLWEWLSAKQPKALYFLIPMTGELGFQDVDHSTAVGGKRQACPRRDCSLLGSLKESCLSCKARLDVCSEKKKHLICSGSDKASLFP